MPAPGPNTLDIARQTKVFRGAGGIGRKRVVVNGPASGDCQAPGGAGVGNLAGVTFDSAEDGGDVALAEHAYEKIRIAEPVPIFSRVEVADVQGRVRALAGVAGSIANIVGVAEEAGTQADQEIVVNLKKFGTREAV